MSTKTFPKSLKGHAAFACVLFAASFFLLSCSKSRKVNKSDIVGSWMEVTFAFPQIFNFNADGTGTDNWSHTLEWNMVGDTIHIKEYSQYKIELTDNMTYIAGEISDTIAEGQKLRFIKLQKEVYKHSGYKSDARFISGDINAFLNEREGYLLTRRGIDWLESDQGKKWLKTEEGQTWLKTEEGKERFATELQERIWVKYEDYKKIMNNRK